MKRLFAAMTFLVLAAMNMNAQNITWNISGANPSQYRSITTDELWQMFEDNQLAGNQRYKIVINDEGYLTETSTTIALLAILAAASADVEPSTKYLFFRDLPRPGGVNGQKIEIYFSQGVTLENLDNYLKWDNNLNIQVKIPVIPVDGYRTL